MYILVQLPCRFYQMENAGLVTAFVTGKLNMGLRMAARYMDIPVDDPKLDQAVVDIAQVIVEYVRSIMKVVETYEQSLSSSAPTQPPQFLLDALCK